jgi:hypothetical protein
VGVKHAVKEGAEGPIGAGVIHRRTDHKAVGKGKPFSAGVDPVIIVHTASGPGAASAAGTAPYRIDPDIKKFCFDCFGFELGSHFRKSGKHTALLVGASVDKQHTHT